MPNRSSIDRTAGAPAFSQLVDILKGQIDQGVYRPGDRLPSESSLCRRYQVSPMTVRRAVQTLLDQDLVNTIKGSGTYVKAPDLGGVTFSTKEFFSIFRDQKRSRISMLEASILRADQATAQRLGLDLGDPVILIKRVLLHDDEPIVYHKEQLIYDPALPIVEAELEVTSLPERLFVSTGESNLKRAEMTIEAKALTQEEADVLRVQPLQPAFSLEHIFYDFNDRPVSWGRFICRGDRLRFTASTGVDGRS